MDSVKSLEEYAEEVFRALTEHFEGFDLKGSDDMPVLREWFVLGIDPNYVVYAISDGMSQGKINDRFSLTNIGKFVVNWFKRECRREAEEARRSIREETLPYNRIEKLAKIVKSVLVELKVSDQSLVNRILNLRNCSDLMEVERALSSLEDEFLKVVERNSPKTKECKRKVERLLERYSLYWDEKILKITEKTLVKKCLKRAYGIPEFSVI